jgi:hypothetical protein
MQYKIVLSDELLKEFYKFKRSSDFDKNLIEKLFNYYTAGELTNAAQLERIGINDTRLLFNLSKANPKYRNKTLEELCEETIYKFILNTERDDYPYININSDRIERNFTATYGKNESRDKTIKHIKALCQNAQNILIYDVNLQKYKDNIITKIAGILPKKQLTIINKDGQLSQTQIKLLKNLCEDWRIKKDRKNTYYDYHDRYLLIDNQIEIILTSGFDYLFDENKEFTYIVRKK